MNFFFKYIRSVVLLLKAGFYCSKQDSAKLNPNYTSSITAPNMDTTMFFGNWTMRDMIYGKPHNKTIIFEHINFYLPTRLPKKPLNQGNHFVEIRKLIFEGKRRGAALIPVEQSLREGYGERIRLF